VILYDLNQVLCVPMIHDGAITGIIYLNRPNSAPGELSSLLDLLTAIAQLSASGAQQARLKAKAQSDEKVRRALERFHAPDVVERVVKDLAKGGTLNARVDEVTATIVFADICGFTSLTEQLPAVQVVDLLNEFYRRMTRVIFSYGGTVDKFIGDSVMAIFGAPYTRPDDAQRAVRAALQMRREFAALISERSPEEHSGIKVGVNTGKVLAGIVGSEARLEYTALGDAVNVASRLEDSALPGQVLVTGATIAAVGQRFRAVPLGERLLRGKTERVPVFEVLDDDPQQPTNPGIV
jgi:adenylate cyclase